jgi:hypothetical protein
MKLPIGQLIKINLDERDPPLLAIVTKSLEDAYELTWSAGGRMISDISSHDQLRYEFSHGYYKLVLD